ncbi:MAG: hypothetical protein O3A46_16555, partial [Candidatus Poribacteria bacterium]|nr:hypothetical protein [Candidatus Poribacteria bacterium]
MTAETATGAPSESSNAERELLFVLPTDIQFVPVVESALTQLCRDLKFDEDMNQLIGVSVVEGAMNAIKHGNKY